MTLNLKLITCLAVSLISMLVGSISGLSWYYFLPISLIALFYYFSVLYRQESLSQGEIDSIYYFGFIITLAALGSSAIEIAVRDNISSFDAKTEIATKFGLGLLATGVGLIGRLVLLPKRVTIETTEDAIQKQIQQVDNLVYEFQRTIDLFQRLRDEVLSKTSKGVEQATETVVDSIKTGLADSIGALSQTIDSFRSSIASIDSDSLRALSVSSKQAAKSFELIASSAPAAGTNLSELSSQLGLLKPKIEGTGASFDLVSNSAAQATESLRTINSLDTSAVRTLEDSLRSLSTAVQALDLAPIDRLSSAAEASEKAVRNLAATTPALVSNIAEMENKLTQLGGTTISTQQSLISLHGITEKLSETMKSFAQVGTIGEDLAKQATQFSESLKNFDLSAISRINSSISSVTKNFEELARSTVDIKSATSANIDLLANDIKNVSGTLRSQINELENASNALTSTLLKYSQALRTATHRNFN